MLTQTCPNCGDELFYFEPDEFYRDDDCAVEEIVCTHCGHTIRNIYSLVFNCTEDASEEEDCDGIE